MLYYSINTFKCFQFKIYIFTTMVFDMSVNIQDSYSELPYRLLNGSRDPSTEKDSSSGGGC